MSAPGARPPSPTSKPVIAVFGSSTIAPSDPGWAVAEELGERLARAGYAVMNGGYGGAMEAVSQGARRHGTEVIGVTTALFNQRGANAYLTHREDTSTLLERLDYLIHTAAGFVVLEGSIGTMAELFLTWNLLAVDGRPGAPLVLLGPAWPAFLAAARAPGLVVPELGRLLRTAETPERAVEMLRAGIPQGAPSH